MEFKLMGENNYKTDALATIFKNRGVDDVKGLIEVSEENVIHYSKLKNMDKALELIIKHSEDGKVFVQVDSDADGYTSSTVLITELQRLFPNLKITWRVHEGKEHGVVVDTVPEGTTLVIIPDAGSNQYEEHKQLREKGIDVLVLDHHDIENGESKDAVVVSPQLSPEYENKQLSGVGVVYKFVKALGEKLNNDNSDEYLDLVAVGNIGDMMDLRSKETRYYVKKGLDLIKNPLLKALVEKQDYSMGGIVNIHNVAFYIVPLINACIRAGKHEEKVNMMNAFLGSNETIYYKRNDVDESIQVAVARNLTNIRTRQNNAKDKAVNLMEEYIQENKLLDDKVLVVQTDDKSSTKLSGLIANQIAKKYKRPIMILRKGKDGDLAGSARGYENGEIKDFSDYLLKSNLVNYCRGHANSFGASIQEDKLDELSNYFKTTLNQEIGHTEVDVDFIIPAEELDSELVRMIAMFRDEWGSTLKEPRIAITNATLGYNDMQLLGKYKNTLKASVNGIDTIKNFFNQEKFNQTFIDGETFIVDLLCTFKLNEWKGKITPQVQIEEINVKETLYF